MARNRRSGVGRGAYLFLAPILTQQKFKERGEGRRVDHPLCTSNETVVTSVYVFADLVVKVIGVINFGD